MRSMVRTRWLVRVQSTFGTRKPMPVYLERSILALARIYINGGRRGYLLGMPPASRFAIHGVATDTSGTVWSVGEIELTGDLAGRYGFLLAVRPGGGLEPSRLCQPLHLRPQR